MDLPDETPPEAINPELLDPTATSGTELPVWAIFLPEDSGSQVDTGSSACGLGWKMTTPPEEST